MVTLLVMVVGIVVFEEATPSIAERHQRFYLREPGLRSATNDSFYEQVRGQGGTTENEKKLRAEIGELCMRVKVLSEERSALHSAVDRLARINQVATLENEALKSCAQRTDAVVVMRLPRPGSNGGERT